MRNRRGSKPSRARGRSIGPGRRRPTPKRTAGRPTAAPCPAGPSITSPSRPPATAMASPAPATRARDVCGSGPGGARLGGWGCLPLMHDHLVGDGEPFGPTIHLDTGVFRVLTDLPVVVHEVSDFRF